MFRVYSEWCGQPASDTRCTAEDSENFNTRSAKCWRNVSHIGPSSNQHWMFAEVTILHQATRLVTFYFFIKVMQKQQTWIGIACSHPVYFRHHQPLILLMSKLHQCLVWHAMGPQSRLCLLPEEEMINKFNNYAEVFWEPFFCRIRVMPDQNKFKANNNSTCRSDDNMRTAGTRQWADLASRLSRRWRGTGLGSTRSLVCADVSVVSSGFLIYP